MIVSNVAKFIRWPDVDRRNEIRRRFCPPGTVGSDGLIGVVDGTHVRIENPSGKKLKWSN